MRYLVLILMIALYGSPLIGQETIVYKISPHQADSLRGQKMPNGSTYNVDVKDKDGNIIISKEQYYYCQIGEEIIYEPLESEDDEE